MAFQRIHSWTLGGLIRAFTDLVLVYFLLCGSAITFLASKFLRIFGLHLPCPCKGVFGYKNSRLCAHKILSDWPSRKIRSVQVMAVERFPFDLAWVKNYICNSNEKLTTEKISENRVVVKLEDEPSCSSCSRMRLLSSVDRECAYDPKAKRITNLKRRSGIRRLRRNIYKCGKSSSVFSSENLQSNDTHCSSFTCDGRMVKEKTSETINTASEKEVSVLDVKDALTSRDMDERTCHSYKFGRSLIDSPRKDKYSSSLERCMSCTQEKTQIVGNEVNRIKLLEQTLEEEKAACATLCLELEKERAAAATAADEAMAMISRLQEEKGSIELEIKHFQRMVDEQVAYDEEEMSVLKEILIRRERENHFLEKELETYRQINIGGAEQSICETKVPLNEWEKMPPFSIETHEDPPHTHGVKSNVINFEIANLPSSYLVAQTYTRNDDGEELEKNEEQKDQIQGNLHSSILSSKPDILDVHVIGDNIELRKEESEKMSHSSFDNNLNEHGDLAFGNLGARRSNASNFSKTSKAEGRGSSYPDIVEKCQIDDEIEMHREGLRMLQNGKEKFSFFPDNGEFGNGQLKLLEEIANQIQGIKQLRDHVRGASLPPSLAKVSLKKRRCQRETWATCESA